MFHFISHTKNFNFEMLRGEICQAGGQRQTKRWSWSHISFPLLPFATLDISYSSVCKNQHNLLYFTLKSWFVIFGLARIFTTESHIYMTLLYLFYYYYKYYCHTKARICSTTVQIAFIEFVCVVGTHEIW